MIRYIAMNKETGKWMLTIFADRFEQVDPNTVNYYRGDVVVAQVDPAELTVSDSGGRANA